MKKTCGFCAGPAPVSSTAHLGFSITKAAGTAAPIGFVMSPLIDPLLAVRGRGPGLAAAMALFVAGLVVGLGLSANLGRQFLAGLVILGVLCGILALLQRVAANTRRRVTAGEA